MQEHVCFAEKETSTLKLCGLEAVFHVIYPDKSKFDTYIASTSVKQQDTSCFGFTSFSQIPTQWENFINFIFVLLPRIVDANYSIILLLLVICFY